MKRLMLTLALIGLLLPAALAQTEKPTIAILFLDDISIFERASNGILDMLQAYKLINLAERAELEEGQDLFGEKLNIIWRSAGNDLPTANIMVEEALDRDPQALLTVSTSVTQIAVNATRDLDDPPAILFSVVSVPYGSGIADAPCIKPAHVAGTGPVRDYLDYLSVVQMQNPDIRVIGSFEAAAEPPSVASVRAITEAADALGLSLVVEAVNEISDLPLATQALLDKGAEAIVASVGPTVHRGMTTIVNETVDYGVPVYAPVPIQVYVGATIAVGFDGLYEQGVIGARMLIAFLNGDLNPGDIRVAEVLAQTVAINYDTAAEQGIDIADAIAERAAFWVADGEASARPPEDLPAMTLEERMAFDAAYLESLRCTPEMIAEQQAALDAAEG